MFCKMWPIHTMEYFSALKRKDVLTPATMQMDLEDIMLSERSQGKTNTVGPHLYVESKQQKTKTKLVDTENRLVVARNG